MSLNSYEIQYRSFDLNGGGEKMFVVERKGRKINKKY